MSDMIKLTGYRGGNAIGVRVSNISIVFGPLTRGGNQSTTVKMADGTEIEVAESYDAVWRLIDDVSQRPR